MQRRDVVHLLAGAPLAGAFEWTALDIERAARALADFRRRGGQYQPTFFTPHEWETVRLLVDWIIPADERSGGATDAGVPEFMDFIVQDQAGRQTAMRGGLAWLDTECRDRFGRVSFVAAGDVERRALLDDIAWPARARPEHSHGVAFFNSFRDLTASGFWSSKMGVEDLRYLGNTAVPDWNGCPDEQLRKLGVSYGD
ncbi:MAG TPA: gluconate 2-dehydrogenase subunit 3 family protein [Gemmatimonadales bacterium]